MYFTAIDLCNFEPAFVNVFAEVRCSSHGSASDCLTKPENPKMLTTKSTTLSTKWLLSMGKYINNDKQVSINNQI